MKGLGTFALIVGICWLIFALGMDVSVPTGAGGRVNNMGLMADRQIHTIVGGMITIAGLLMVLLGGKRPPSLAKVETDTRLCPLCAETIKNAAIKCKHCGADIETRQESSEPRLLESNPEKLTVEAPVEAQASSRNPGLGFLSLCFGLIAVIVGGVLYRVLPPDTMASRTPKSEAYRPAADEQIKLDSAAFGCTLTSDFDRALDHYGRSEYSAWAEIAGGQGCFYQSNVNPDISWTVMQVRDDRMQIGLKRASEYSKDPELGKFNYWTATRWAQQPSSPTQK